jgi:hypothetical protein
MCLEYQDSLDRMFHALGEGSRRAMIDRRARGPAAITLIAGPFELALPTVVQHPDVLETARIVTSISFRAEPRRRNCRLRSRPDVRRSGRGRGIHHGGGASPTIDRCRHRHGGHQLAFGHG